MQDKCFVISPNDYYKYIESFDNSKFVQDRISMLNSRKKYIDIDAILNKNFSHEESAVSSHKVKIEIKKGEMPIELSHISDAISNAKYILNLEAGWDGFNAIKIPEIIFNRTATFITTYANWLFDIYNIILDYPDISPVNDGSINLEWNTNKASLLVKIKNHTKQIAYFYGEKLPNKDNEENKFDFNGQVPTVGIEDDFVTFLKNLTIMGN